MSTHMLHRQHSPQLWPCICQNTVNYLRGSRQMLNEFSTKSRPVSVRGGVQGRHLVGDGIGNVHKRNVEIIQPACTPAGRPVLRNHMAGFVHEARYFGHSCLRVRRAVHATQDTHPRRRPVSRSSSQPFCADTVSTGNLSSNSTVPMSKHQEQANRSSGHATCSSGPDLSRGSKDAHWLCSGSCIQKGRPALSRRFGDVVCLPGAQVQSTCARG